MDFNTFYKLTRNTKSFKKLIEAKENDKCLNVLNTREFMAVSYANDIYDNNKLTLKEILKRFDKRLHKLVIGTLTERLKAKQNKKIIINWTKANFAVLHSILHNKNNVNDKEYFNLYYPKREF